MTKRRVKSFCAVAVLALSHPIAVSAQGMETTFEARADEFINSCASCHGRDGKGAGFLTRVFKGVDPGDLTMLAANNGGEFPVDEVFAVIDGRADIAAHGDRQMPVWGDRYRDQEFYKWGPDRMNAERVRHRILELVHFLQSIQQ
ncbi:MAG: cytochrome c [Roseovarius sp.]|nr:cytochrome c [Roseovarius sp.]